jgi:hypothetical protein
VGTFRGWRSAAATLPPATFYHPCGVKNTFVLSDVSGRFGFALERLSKSALADQEKGMVARAPDKSGLDSARGSGHGCPASENRSVGRVGEFLPGPGEGVG